MANYVVTTDFAPKDALPTGNPAKAAQGTQVATEFNNIATAIATKQDTANKGVANGYASLDVSGDVPDTELPATLPRLGLDNIFTGVQIVSGTQPTVRLTRTSGGANSKHWLMWLFGDQFRLSLANDASPNAELTPVISVTRSATTATVMNFGATSITANGNTIWHAGNDGTGSGCDADFLDGLNAATAAVANTVAARDASGHINAVNFNQASANSENPTVSQIMVTNGSDNYLRKATVAHVKSALGLPKMAWCCISSGTGGLNTNISSSNITSTSKVGTGTFTVDYTAAGFTTVPSIQTTTFGAPGYAFATGSTTSTSASISTYTGNVNTGTGVPIGGDRDFMFLAVGI